MIDGLLRTVITGMDKTLESLIVLSHILIDPDEENLYYASKIWSVCWLVGRLVSQLFVCWSVCRNSLKRRTLLFHALIRALVIN